MYTYITFSSSADISMYIQIYTPVWEHTLLPSILFVTLLSWLAFVFFYCKYGINFATVIILFYWWYKIIVFS